MAVTLITAHAQFNHPAQYAAGAAIAPYGPEIREVGRLRRQYGIANWRKRKGIATVRLSDGTIRLAEIHWYEATGIGKRETKIKRYLD